MSKGEAKGREDVSRGKRVLSLVDGGKEKVSVQGKTKKWAAPQGKSKSPSERPLGAPLATAGETTLVAAALKQSDSRG